MLSAASLAIGLCLLAAAADAPLVAVPDPAAALRPETPAERQARHAAVARLRQGTVLLLHRAGRPFAADNSLAAIRSGLALGCQAVELDLRRTRDGVIVLFHDDRLERLVDGFGTVEESYYEELLLYRRMGFQPVPPIVDGLKTHPTDMNGLKTHPADEPIPAWNTVMQTLRDEPGLVMLDIKTPGIDGPLLAELRKADMLDHVIACNEPNGLAFQKGVISPLAAKGALIENRADMDPRQVQAVLDRPGQTVFLDDPRAALTLLGRPAMRGGIATVQARTGRQDTRDPAPALEAVLRGTRGDGVNLPVRLAAVRLAIASPRRFVALADELSRRADAEARRAAAWNLGMIAKHRPALIDDPVRAVLLRLLDDPDEAVRAEAAVACGRAKVAAAADSIVALLARQPVELDRAAGTPAERRRRAAILGARGHYACALGLLGGTGDDARRFVVHALAGGQPPANAAADRLKAALQDAFAHREVGPDKTWLGVDGAAAAWALGRLRVREAVPLFRQALQCQPPAKEPEDEAVPLVHWDLQTPRVVAPALAAIGSPEARAVLESIISLPAGDLKRRSPELLSCAAEALAGFPAADRPAIIARLLRHGAPQVRGAAVERCLSEPDRMYRDLLEKEAKWAVPWWDAHHAAAPWRTRPACLAVPITNDLARGPRAPRCKP